ncbi:MAG: lysozyme [Steroidobacteraceae bacterium]|nr:lysozyme [Steroidobacteraceae bacterium]MDW8258855.1 lysozyme [Gammaproteobacteria bacterium]
MTLTLAADLVRRHEGLRLEAYRDAAGILTIGYGHTGPEVMEGARISRTEAERLLRRDLEQAAATVDRAVKVPLRPNQKAALISFVFNVGAQTFLRSTLLRKINAGEFEAVPAELAKYVHARDPATGEKRALKGLTARRVAEAALWSQDDARPVPVKPATLKDVIQTNTARGAAITAAAPAGAVLISALNQLDTTKFAIVVGVAVLVGLVLAILWRWRN